ncbi:hypothetical protein RRG08_034658 [Elysia crispata]|uniref:Mos1 transposase HTH domain-containing protein n=1 Tax=Elysia crispata TaxID=231223 RepID=A0AAE0Z119_9GAST|nr:hypothetical protein RRG08_034658 [Elysia crispata]
MLTASVTNRSVFTTLHFSEEGNIRLKELKDYLKGNRYETDEDVKNAVLSWCRDKTADFFADGIQQVVRRWRLCIERDGDYVEK